MLLALITQAILAYERKGSREKCGKVWIFARPSSLGTYVY
jgi:hypothetical protein